MFLKSSDSVAIGAEVLNGAKTMLKLFNTE